MQLSDFQQMDSLFSKTPPINTTLGLSLQTASLPPSPSPSPIGSTQAPSSTPSHAFSRVSHLSFPSSSPLMSFLGSSHLPATPRYLNTCNSFNNDEVSIPKPSPPVQLELLPLRPTSLKLSSSPSSTSPWPQPIIPPFNFSPRTLSRGIDVNQMPATADPDEFSGADTSSPMAPARTLDSSFLMMKRTREKSSDAEQERTCEVSSRGSDDDGEGGGSARKKLRLSKEQSTLLEESFKEHSTLNPKQKAELAKQLNLRPRQVEVWFQNRRARTKLKQTEVDCELLKRCCESLTEENRRLQKEVQELRAIKVAPPCVIAHDLFMPLPAATLTMCPSCERLASHAPDNTTTTLGFATKSTMPGPMHLHHHRPSFPQPPPQPHAQPLPSAAC